MGIYNITMETELSKKIRIEMILKNVTGSKIARGIGVDRSAINKTIRGKITSNRLRKAIADAIGCNVMELWPDAKKKKRYGM